MFLRPSLLTPFLVLVAPAWGQGPGIELQLETTVLETGESIVAKLVCTNIDEPDIPQVVMPDGLELSLLNETPSVLNQSSWVNGRMSRSVTYTYQVQIIARKPGRYRVGPVELGEMKPGEARRLGGAEIAWMMAREARRKPE